MCLLVLSYFLSYLCCLLMSDFYLATAHNLMLFQFMKKYGLCSKPGMMDLPERIEL